MHAHEAAFGPELEAAHRRGIGDELDGDLAIRIDGLVHFRRAGLRLRHCRSRHLAEHVVQRHQRPAEREAARRHDQQTAGQAPVGALALAGIGLCGIRLHTALSDDGKAPGAMNPK